MNQNIISKVKENKYFHENYQSSCHGLCLVTFFPKNNQRMALTESPMMAASPLFSATITTSHLRRTYIGAPSEYFLHSTTTKRTCILIIVITNQHHVLSTAAQPQPHRVVTCTFVNNLLAFVDRPLCTVPMILLQCYCN